MSSSFDEQRVMLYTLSEDSVWASRASCGGIQSSKPGSKKRPDTTLPDPRGSSCPFRFDRPKDFPGGGTSMNGSGRG